MIFQFSNWRNFTISRFSHSKHAHKTFIRTNLRPHFGHHHEQARETPIGKNINNLLQRDRAHVSCSESGQEYGVFIKKGS